MTDRDIKPPNLTTLAAACLAAAETATPAPWWLSDIDGAVMSGDPDADARSIVMEVGDADWGDEDLQLTILARTALPQLASGYLEAVGELARLHTLRDTGDLTVIAKLRTRLADSRSIVDLQRANLHAKDAEMDAIDAERDAAREALREACDLLAIARLGDSPPLREQADVIRKRGGL